MNERIALILAYLKVPQSEFAKRLSVSSSNLSHILSNRHRPGADFFEQLVLSYPMINIEWVLTGRGEMLKAQAPTELFPEMGIPYGIHPETGITYLEKPDSAVSEAPNEDFPKASRTASGGDNVTTPAKPGRKIRRVILVYSDSTFEELTPGEGVATD